MSTFGKLALACILFWIAFAFCFCLAWGAVVKVSWDAAPEEEQVTSYRVWRGIEILAEVTEPTAEVELPTHEPSVLTVTAINATGESPHSEPLHLLPVVPQTSVDLVTWFDHKAFFVTTDPADSGPAISKQFFRLKYPKP